MADGNTSSASSEETINPNLYEASPFEIDNALDTQAQEFQKSLPLEKSLKFWETQPVLQFKDIGNTNLPVGPIEPPTPLSEVKQEPYNLPDLYEWVACDMNAEDMCSEVYAFLANNYVGDDEFRFNYSKEFLRWALQPPGFCRNWHIGVCVKSSQELVAFITGVPARIRVCNEVFNMIEIDFLCVHKMHRSKRLTPLLIKELVRRMNLRNIWQAAFTSGSVLFAPTTTSRYWHRFLNPKKLIDVKFCTLQPNMTMSQTIELYKLPELTVTRGFRKMEIRDVPAVTKLLRGYLSQFIVAPDFDENDVEHWFVPKENVVDSYLVESPGTHDITDFCSFYTVPTTILGNQNYSTLKVAYSYYNVSTKTPLFQLMNDALIVANQKEYDVFNALDIMHNKSFVKKLKFVPGSGNLRYYLYNYRISDGLEPSELGLVLL